MSDAHADIAGKAKPASGPGKAAARKRRGTERKAYERNSLYTLAAEFKQRNPLATAQDAWRHFAGLVGISTVLVAFDSTADVLTYAPDPERFGARQIKRRSFERGYYRLVQETEFPSA
jgi:hypothetical protein